MKLSKLILFTAFILSLFGSSCSFNKSFFHPNPEFVATPPDASSGYYQLGLKDSIHYLFYERENPIASIFLLHGNAGTLNGWSEVADLYFQAGYQVFIIDYPSFGNSTGEATYKNVIRAGKLGAQAFNNHQKVKGTKRIIMGLSLGGNLATMVAVEHPDCFDALVIEGAFDTQKGAARARLNRPFKFIGNLLVKNHIKAHECLKSWTKPLLIIHSTEDEACPFEMAERMYNSATSTNNKELWTIKGPHLKGLSYDFDLYLIKIKNLITRK